MGIGQVAGNPRALFVLFAYFIVWYFLSICFSLSLCCLLACLAKFIVQSKQSFNRCYRNEMSVSAETSKTACTLFIVLFERSIQVV
jgi:hypothetical protein